MKKIEIGKKYRTRDGRPAEVVRTGLLNTRRPVLAVITLSSGKQASWQYSEYGSPYESDGPCDLPESVDDLVEVVAYTDIPIDTPGWGFDTVAGNGNWFPCHFAGVSDSGLPMSWCVGQTSHTTTSKTSWDEFTTTKPEVVE